MDENNKYFYVEVKNLVTWHKFTFAAFSVNVTLRVDFQCWVVFTCVKFPFANKIEAMHERSLVSVKLNLAQLLV